MDAAVIPALLLLVARDLLLHDPPRVLAWRLLHDPALANAPAWLQAFLPRTSPGFDSDPVAVLLAGLAGLLATTYLVLAAAGARWRWRALVVIVAGLLLVAGPALAFVTMGAATDRPYGQDGGVVQLPLAVDLILAGQSPHGADYSDTILGKQARGSAFWEPFGGNPILHHHAYLAGTHWIMAPFQLASRAILGFFDPRFVTFLAWALLAWLAVVLVPDPRGRVIALAVCLVNPLVYWHQIFGANDLVFAAAVLASVLCAERKRPLLSGLLLGVACATKQLAWPFAPFVLLHLSGAQRLIDLVAVATWRRVLGPALVVAGVFAALVIPVAALDFRAFWGDIVVYNVGLPGGDNYPLGGTPGFGFANFLIYFGKVTSLRDHVSFSRFYLLLVPLGLLLARAQMRTGRAAAALVNGSVALLASVYFSRVVHPNYLVPLAVLLPVGVLALRWRADLVVVPLSLLAVAVEMVQNEVFRATWDQAVAGGFARHVTGLAGTLLPRCGDHLTHDPIGLLVGAVAAGLGLMYLAVAALGAGPKVRFGLAAVAVLAVVVAPARLVAVAGDRTGPSRVQDPWTVQARADGARLAAGESPWSTAVGASTRTGREAWSTSFRLEPPRVFEPSRPLLPSGGSTLAALGRLVGASDPRSLLLLALGGVLLLVILGLPVELRPMGLGFGALLPFVSVGTVFGTPVALGVVLVAGGFVSLSMGAPILAGLLGGAAAAMDASYFWPLVLLLALSASGASGGRRAVQRMAVAATAAFVLLGLAPLPFGPGAFLEALGRPGDLTAGFGLSNFLLYFGLENEAWVRGLFALVPLLLAVVVAGLVIVGRRRGIVGGVGSARALLVASAMLLLALVLAPSLSPDLVAVPLGLAALAAARQPS